MECEAMLAACTQTDEASCEFCYRDAVVQASASFEAGAGRGPAEPDGGTRTTSVDGCVPAHCPPEACGEPSDGCGGKLDCGNCAGTLSCNWSEDFRCGADSFCARDHLCAHVLSEIELPDYAPSHVVVMLFANRPDTTRPLAANPIMRKLVSTGLKRLNPARWEVDVDLSDWTAPAAGHFVVALSSDGSGAMKTRDLLSEPTRQLSVRLGGAYDLGVLRAQFPMEPEDVQSTPGHDGAFFVHCLGACPFRCCVGADEMSCRFSCDTAAMLQIGCDGPEDCSSGDVCCTRENSSGSVLTSACTRNDCRYEASPLREQRCHVNSNCPVGEQCDAAGKCRPPQ